MASLSLDPDSMKEGENRVSLLARYLLAAAMFLYVAYLCFAYWGLPRIIEAQLEERAPALLGRSVSLDRAAFNPFTLEVSLFGLEVGAAGAEKEALLSLSRLSVNPQLSSVFGTISLASLELERGELRLGIDASGELEIQDLLGRLGTEPDSGEAQGEAGPGLPALVLGLLEVDDFVVAIQDESVGEGYSESLVLERLRGWDIGTLEKKSPSAKREGGPVYHWSFASDWRSESGASMSVRGGATSIEPWEISLELQLDGLPLGSLQPYVDERVALAVEGMLSAEALATVRYREDALQARAEASLALAGLLASDEDQVYLQVSELVADGLAADLASRGLRLEKLALSAPRARVVRLDSGALRQPKAKAAASGREPEPDDAGTPDFSVELESLLISGGEISFEDLSLEEPFAASLQDLDFSARDLGLFSPGGDIELQGIAEAGFELLGGQVEAGAELQSLEGSTSFNARAWGLELERLQPYVAARLNGRLERAVLDLRADGSLRGFADPQISGDFLLEDLKFSESGESRSLLEASSISALELSADLQSLSVGELLVVEPRLGLHQDEQGLNLSRLARFEQEVGQAVSETEERTGLAMEVKRLELTGGSLEFVDTNLLSSHRSFLGDFDLKVEGASTEVSSFADFEFSGKLDESAKVAGSGKVMLSDPRRYLDLDLEFAGYDLTATSPYWETYLGRKLDKGQFVLSSRYEVRDSQMSGSNDIRIDQITLGDRVDSDRAVNLPVGFAIKLMQDPEGLIAFDGFKVTGDLSEPKVKPWIFVGRAIRNLILNAVASPFKFLAGVAGGNEDLDTISFSHGVIDLSESAREQVEALRDIMIQRPAIAIEVAYASDPEETLYLKSRYMQKLIIDDQFSPRDVFELLEAVDADLLRSRVELLYEDALALESQLGDERDALEAANASDAGQDPAAEGRERRSVLGRVAAVLGLGSGSRPQEPQVAQSGDARRDSIELPADQPAEQGVEFQAKLDLVLSLQAEVSIEEAWLEQLKARRIQSFRQSLLAGEEVDGARVFAVDAEAFGGGGPLGVLRLRLSD